MSVYRFTGPPENWITAIGIGKWAVSELNRSIWEKLEPGDIALLHSAKTRAAPKAISAIVGYAVVGPQKWVKEDLWWMQEKAEQRNKWPYVFTLDEVYLFADVQGIDFAKDNTTKPEQTLRDEAVLLASSGIPTSDLIKRAKELDTTVPQFPFNGSASSVNPIYEWLILEENDSFFQVVGEKPYELKEQLNMVFDRELLGQNTDDLLASARAYKPSSAGHILRDGERLVRKDNEAQKRKIARIEDYTCQVCGFRCDYVRKDGSVGHICEVDHILEKQEQGDERADNLWVLCPNCHAKKTLGVIIIDTKTRTVRENGRPLSIHDKHLWV